MMVRRLAKALFFVGVLLILLCSASASVPFQLADKHVLDRRVPEITVPWSPAAACATVIAFEFLRRRRSKSCR